MKRFITIIFIWLNFGFFAFGQIPRMFKSNSGWISSLPRTNSIDDILVVQDSVWFGTENGLSLTTNGGISWTNFFGASSVPDTGISAIAINNNFIWIAKGFSENLNGESVQTGGGLRYSTDRGSTWSFIPQPVDKGTVDTLMYGNNHILALDVTVPQQNITFDIALTKNTVWIASWAGGLRKSIDSGKTWQRVILPPDNLDSIKPTDSLNYVFDLSPASGLIGLRANNNHLLFSVYSSNDSTIWAGSADGINKSTDYGISWQKFSHQNQTRPISGDFVVAINEQRWDSLKIIWAATVNASDSTEIKGVSYSSDGGNTWNTTLLGEWAHNITFKDSIVYVATDDGLFRSSDFGLSWIKSGSIYDPTNLQRFFSSECFGVGVKGDTVWFGGPEGIAYTIDSPSQQFGSIWHIFRTAEQVENKKITYAFPNPFSPSNEPVRLHYSLNTGTAGTEQVSIRIFDYGMLPVRTLIQNASRANGKEYDEIWDGKNDNHSTVINGVYFYRVDISNQQPIWGKILGTKMKILFFTIAVIFLLSISLSIVALSQLQSSSSDGGLAGAPFRMGFGARGMGMGNAMTAVISGDLQSYYNPALVPFESQPTAAAAYGDLSLDRNLNFLSYTNNLKPDAGFSLSIINAGVGNIDGRDDDGIHTETYSTSENAFMLSFGIKPSSDFAFGVTAKILYYSLFSGIQSTTAAIDMGAIYLLSQEFTVGAVVQDIDAKYKWDTSQLYGELGNASSDYFPLRKRIGLSWTPKFFPIILSGEFEFIGSAPYFRFGSEIEVYDGVHIRGGIDQIAVNTDLPAKPSVGISFQTKVANWTPSFDYAYIFEPYSPSGIHILSLALRF